MGLPLLILTLALQIPIMHTPGFSYHSQTVVSVNIDYYLGKFWDIEPGSYVHFIYFKEKTTTDKFSFGLNLIPLLAIYIFWRRARKGATT